MFTSMEIKSLNELEFNVYRYITENQKSIRYMSIRELADASHVSTSTVLRFCKKMGCNGYSEFKVEFKHYLDSLFKTKKKYDSSEITNFFNHAFTETYQNELEQIALILSQSENIIFIGIGNSACTAQYAARYFSNTGKFSVCVSDPFFPINQSLKTHSTVVAVSVSGETEEILYLANKFKINKCTIISITNSKDCTLAQISDYNINCYVSMQKIGPLDLTTQVPILYIIEQLAYRQCNCLPDNT